MMDFRLPKLDPYPRPSVRYKCSYCLVSYDTPLEGFGKCSSCVIRIMDSEIAYKLQDLLETVVDLMVRKLDSRTTLTWLLEEAQRVNSEGEG